METKHTMVLKDFEPSTPPRPMSFEEFLEWDNGDVWAEWVDGEVIRLSPATLLHQLWGKFLLLILDAFVEANDLGLILPPPFVMKLPTQRTGREPDLLFISKSNMDRVKDTYLKGPADLAVEIISPESRVRDREIKLKEYEKGGVLEYWLFDPEAQHAEFYQRDDQGAYVLCPPDEHGIYRSRVLDGLWLNMAWFRQMPLPSHKTILAEWGLS